MKRPPPIEKQTVVVRGQTIHLDPDHMKFDDLSIPDYMEREYEWVDHLGKQLELANNELLLAEIDEEAIHAKVCTEAKDLGYSDGMSKMKASCHPDVIAARKLCAEHKLTVGFLKAHIKAWDKNHANVQNRNHTLRKELDKLGRDSYKPDSVDDVLGTAEDFLDRM